MLRKPNWSVTKLVRSLPNIHEISVYRRRITADNRLRLTRGVESRNLQHDLQDFRKSLGTTCLLHIKILQNHISFVHPIGLLDLSSYYGFGNERSLTCKFRAGLIPINQQRPGKINIFHFYIRPLFKVRVKQSLSIKTSSQTVSLASGLWIYLPVRQNHYFQVLIPSQAFIYVLYKHYRRAMIWIEPRIHQLQQICQYKF